LTDALGDRADAEDFFRWSADNFYPTYSWQGMIDRREAPRWDPDWISPDHVYSELYGRTRIALDTLPEGDRPAQWISASEVALTRLRDSGRILDSVLPGPFDDFHEDPNISPVLMQIFEVTESKLDDATYLNDVPGIVAFAYSNKLTPSALDNVARILNRRVDEPITNDGQDITYLHLCAHISGAARSETVAASVINRSLYAARNSGSRERVADLFAIIVEACAAHRDPHKYRELLGTTAAQLCFAVDNSRHLSLLEAAFDALTVRDEKLSPPIGKARAIARTRLKAS
jgi:hypothetical protein